MVRRRTTALERAREHPALANKKLDANAEIALRSFLLSTISCVERRSRELQQEKKTKRVTLAQVKKVINAIREENINASMLVDDTNNNNTFNDEERAQSTDTDSDSSDE